MRPLKKRIHLPSAGTCTCANNAHDFRSFRLEICIKIKNLQKLFCSLYPKLPVSVVLTTNLLLPRANCWMVWGSSQQPCWRCHGVPNIQHEIKYNWFIEVKYCLKLLKQILNIAAAGTTSHLIHRPTDFWLRLQVPDQRVVATRGNPFGKFGKSTCFLANFGSIWKFWEVYWIFLGLEAFRSI